MIREMITVCCLAVTRTFKTSSFYQFVLTEERSNHVVSHVVF